MRVCSAALAIPKSASLVVCVSLCDEEVAGLDVAMHHARAMGVVQPVAGVAHDSTVSSTSSGLRSRSRSAHEGPSTYSMTM